MELFSQRLFVLMFVNFFSPALFLQEDFEHMEETIQSLTTDEMMRYFKCSRSYLYQKDVQVRLGAFKLGNQLRWPLKNAILFIKENQVVTITKKVEVKRNTSKKIASRHNIW